MIQKLNCRINLATQDLDFTLAGNYQGMAQNDFLKVSEEVLKQSGFKNCRITVYSAQLFLTSTLMHENERIVFKRVSGELSRNLKTNIAGSSVH